MSPQLVIFLIEEAVKETPALVNDLRALFSSGTPTKEQFAELREKVQSEDYGTIVPNSEIPAGQ